MFLFSKTFTFSVLIWTWQYCNESPSLSASNDKGSALSNSLNKKCDRILNERTNDERERQDQLKNLQNSINKLFSGGNNDLMEKLSALSNNENFKKQFNELMQNDVFQTQFKNLMQDKNFVKHLNALKNNKHFQKNAFNQMNDDDSEHEDIDPLQYYNNLKEYLDEL
ncbi:Plasmodium exported protein, unknown function [Plasmodium vivax]|uniref:Pv-fam-d protein n=2 Tax=Plasmodium vivax TaxID=5855 RepID=A0A0J9SS47_PLAV1|nr:hypothetical protein PVBG_00567 [Plasmodium vivax Brazil I]CAG9472675.1 unnamed protein product [Plasmodium vivax]CAI7723880.1 Plasmodium exported protein, unknown function [Plasmodium vivax]SCO70289.1 Plasmodium exported protein, unknown function [Plasmodium vivax]SCO75781.1 Plasmodium exported protein, unknown function [Plasmodium vivax]